MCGNIINEGIGIMIEMSDREKEISFAMDLIWGMCEEANIGIIPKKDKNGTWRVGILYPASGKEYFMIREKKQ